MEKARKALLAQEKANKGENQMSDVTCWNCGKSGHYASDCREKWSGDKGKGKSKRGEGKVGKGKVKGKGKGKLNSVENSNWQERWLETGTSHPEQGEEHADGWWNEEHVDGWWKDEQTSSSSEWWMTANDKTPWEPEKPLGGFEINSVEQKYIKHDRWRQEWLMLNYDSGAAVGASPVAVAGDPPLEKRGEFRVAQEQSFQTRGRSR